MILKSFVFCLLLNSISGGVQDFSMPTYDTALSRVLIDYCSHMMEVSPVINLMQVSHPNNTINQLLFMNEVMHHASINGAIFRVIPDVDYLPKFVDRLKNRKRLNTIVFVDSLKAFYKLFSFIEPCSWRYSGRIIIAMTVYIEDIYHFMKYIFEAFWSKHIVNVVVMFMPHVNTNEVLLYTYYPFSKFYCEYAVPVLLDHYRDNNYLKPIDYFPSKLDNLHGCPLTVVTFRNPPFMFLNKDDTGGVHADGIDGIVLRVLAQQLNFNVTIYNDPAGWGRIHDNGTVTGESINTVETKSFTNNLF